MTTRMKTNGIVAATIAVALLPAAAMAQSRPTLHVNTRWEECAFQLDPSLTQAAWHQFTQEAGQVVYFRPLAGARPMGRGKFELSFMQVQTNVDDNDSAWNDTFVHPHETHWLYEGSGLKFPGVAARAGVASRTDVGVFFTQNPNSNYGVYAVQLQHNLIGSDAHAVDLSVRGSFMSLFGPEDLDVNVYGADVIVSARPWTYSRATVVPYAGLTTYLSSSHEKSSVVTLADENVVGVMGTVGAELRVSVVRVAAEASLGPVPGMALKFGFGR